MRCAPDLGRAAGGDFAVLISGEAGVGKEWVARVVHAKSARSRHPFHPVDCHQPPARLETELERLTACAGTVYLRHVDALNEWLQECVAKALGSEEPHARVIASTRRNVDALALGNHLLPTLLYRINLMHLAIPPLRDQREAIPVLFRSLLQTGEDSPVLEPGGITALTSHEWPGNVRELEAVAARIVARGLASVGAADVRAAMESKTVTDGDVHAPS